MRLAHVVLPRLGEGHRADSTTSATVLRAVWAPTTPMPFRCASAWFVLRQGSGRVALFSSMAAVEPKLLSWSPSAPRPSKRAAYWARQSGRGALRDAEARLANLRAGHVHAKSPQNDDSSVWLHGNEGARGAQGAMRFVEDDSASSARPASAPVDAAGRSTRLNPYRTAVAERLVAPFVFF